ncbi:tumor necrosis factor ligand superfamily member 15 [Lissotriton helveticus]
MEGGAHTMLQEESGLVQQTGGAPKRVRKALLAAACCLLAVCTLGAPTAYVLRRNSNAAKQSASAVQIQTRSLHASKHQPTGVSHPQEDKPRAHLTVRRGMEWQKIAEMNAVQWEDTIGLAFNRKGMTYVKPHLKVPLSGDYFIYTQVTFRHNAGKTNPLHLRIQKISLSYGKPEDLLVSTERSCANCNFAQSIYLGGVVTLKEGDSLLVIASEIHMVDKTEHKTFFGAFLL